MLAHCESRGGLNLSDISRWLDAHVTTVHGWAKDERLPRKHKRSHIMMRLARLVELVNSKPPGEPIIPYDLNQNLRASFIEKLKDEHLRILQEDTAP